MTRQATVQGGINNPGKMAIQTLGLGIITVVSGVGFFGALQKR